MRSLPVFIVGILLIAVSVILALIFFYHPIVIDHSTVLSSGDWTFGYWFLTIVLGIGGMVLVGVSGEKND